MGDKWIKPRSMPLQAPWRQHSMPWPQSSWRFCPWVAGTGSVVDGAELCPLDGSHLMAIILRCVSQVDQRWTTASHSWSTCGQRVKTQAPSDFWSFCILFAINNPITSGICCAQFSPTFPFRSFGLNMDTSRRTFEQRATFRRNTWSVPPGCLVHQWPRPFHKDPFQNPV